MKPKVFFAALAVTATPSAGSAHWQYTRWGMTQEQVIAASHGKAVIRPKKLSNLGGKPETELGGSYEAAGRAFDLVFTLSNGKLSLVTLTTKSCGGLGTDLRSIYGQPLSVQGGAFPVTQWDDKQNGNRVTFVDGLLGSCQVSYGPLAKNSGL